MSAGDYRFFRSENAANRGQDTSTLFAKARHWRTFLRYREYFLQTPHSLAGDAVLIAPVSYAISQLSGNLTGNFAIFGHLDTDLRQEIAVPQGFI
jgi:hypothetical protein